MTASYCLQQAKVSIFANYELWLFLFFYIWSHSTTPFFQFTLLSFPRLGGDGKTSFTYMRCRALRGGDWEDLVPPLDLIRISWITFRRVGGRSMNGWRIYDILIDFKFLFFRLLPFMFGGLDGQLEVKSGGME